MSSDPRPNVLPITTDHGEMMYERGRPGKGHFAEAVFRAPRIVAPGAWSRAWSRRTTLPRPCSTMPAPGSRRG